MRLKLIAKLLRGSGSYKAMACSLAGGFNPRTVLWRRKMTPAEQAVQQGSAPHAG